MVGPPCKAETALTASFEYNAAGWPVAQTDAAGNRTEVAYDGHGLVTRIDRRERVPESPTGEEAFTTFYEYDGLDRLISVTDSLGNAVCYEHDSRDPVVLKADPLGNVIRYEYDAYGRIITETAETTDDGTGSGFRLLGLDTTTRYSYDRNGNLTAVFNADGVPMRISCDACDRQVKLLYPDGTAMEFQYDGNDNRVLVRDNNGLVKRITYSYLNMPLYVEIDTSRLKPDCHLAYAADERFEYDALGQLTPAANDLIESRFSVDSLGRVYEETVRFAGTKQVFTIRGGYDDFGFLGRLEYPEGQAILRKPDALNRIS
jgi:YD repeat-containing protein